MADYPSIPIAFPLEESPPDYGTIRTKFEDGYVQTRNRSTIGPREYSFAHEVVPAADVATWRAFWAAQKGGLVFNFTDPNTGAVVVCRFKTEARPRIRRTGPLTYDIGPIELEEAL